MLRTCCWNWTSAKRLLGKLNFTNMAIPLGRLQTRNHQKASSFLPKSRPKETFSILYVALKECLWWRAHVCDVAQLFQKNLSFFLSTDVWGIGILKSDSSKGLSERMAYKQKRIIRSLPHNLPAKNALKGKSVLLQSDNRTVVSYIRNQDGTKSLSLPNLTNCLFTLANKIGISLTAHYILSCGSSIADGLSRQEATPDWHLSRSATKRIFQIWGAPQIDLFASKLLKVVPVYVLLLQILSRGNQLLTTPW